MSSLLPGSAGMPQLRRVRRSMRWTRDWLASAHGPLPYVQVPVLSFGENDLFDAKVVGADTAFGRFQQ